MHLTGPALAIPARLLIESDDFGVRLLYLLAVMRQMVNIADRRVRIKHEALHPSFPIKARATAAFALFRESYWPKSVYGRSIHRWLSNNSPIGRAVAINRPFSSNS
jgi:hypothetical protein